MSSEITIALIGVGATLAGTVLDWFLNNLSNKGKLNIFVCSWEDIMHSGELEERDIERIGINIRDWLSQVGA